MTEWDGGRKAENVWWPLNPEFLKKRAAALRTAKDGPRVSVTVELSPQAAAVLMRQGLDWRGQVARVAALDPATDEEILSAAAARELEILARTMADHWAQDPWVSLMLAATGRAEAESGE